MLSTYLAELERELAERLPQDDVQVRLQEAEAHLREGIEGRIELGLSFQEAERETIAAFGAARQVGQAIVRPVHAHSVAVRLRWLGAAYLILGLCYAALDLLRERVPFLAPAMVTVLGFCVLAVAVTAYRARCAALIPLLLTGLAGSGAFFFLFGACWLNLGEYGDGPGYVSRFGINAIYQESRLRLAEGVPNGTSPRAWAMSQNSFLEETVESIPKALANPIGNAVSMTGPAIGMGMGIAVLAAATDLVGAGLGVLATRRRRRPTLA